MGLHLCDEIASFAVLINSRAPSGVWLMQYSWCQQQTSLSTQRHCTIIIMTTLAAYHMYFIAGGLYVDVGILT